MIYRPWSSLAIWEIVWKRSLPQYLYTSRTNRSLSYEGWSYEDSFSSTIALHSLKAMAIVFLAKANDFMLKGPCHSCTRGVERRKHNPKGRRVEPWCYSKPFHLISSAFLQSLDIFLTSRSWRTGWRLDPFSGQATR